MIEAFWRTFAFILEKNGKYIHSEVQKVMDFAKKIGFFEEDDYECSETSL